MRTEKHARRIKTSSSFRHQSFGFLACLAILALCQPGRAGDYYVAPDGDDGNSGTLEEPLATIQAARDAVRAEIAGGMSEDITVYLGAGDYFIEQPVVFDDRDSGRDGFTITYQGAPQLGTRIYGGRRITNWTQLNDTQYAATVADLQQHYTLYENDQAANGGLFHVFADASAGNWSRNGTQLVYQPRNLPITGQVVVLGTTKDVFVVMGRSTQQIVSNLVFDGLHMIGSDYTGSWPGGEVNFPGYTGTYDGVQLTNIPIGVIFPEARHGQFYLRNAQNIVVRNSKLYGAGFMAAFFDRWAQSNRVENCWIENTGRDGLYFQGWEPGRGASDGITTLAESYCNKFNVVTNNVIYDVGRFGGSMAVRFDFSGDNRLDHNIIKGASGGAYHGHGWRPNMINILGYYVVHGMPASGIPYPYDQAHITFYDDDYVVTRENQGAELNHCRNNLIQYNDVSQSPRVAGDTGMITQWGAGPNSVWAYNAVHDNVALGGWCYFCLYNDDGSHQPRIESNVLYWINATASNTAGIVSKGNFQINTGNIFADCILGQGGANIGPFCEEATRATWSNNIVAAQVGAPFVGGAGTQTPVQAVKSAYMIVGATDTDANITSICGPNANTAYPLLQSAGNNVYYYQPLDRADSPGSGAANLQSQVTANQSRDTNSIYADPLFDRQHPWWDARYTDYALQAASPALARGFQQFDLSQIGLQAGFPFDVTNILGQSVNKIRAAGNFSRLLKVGTNGSQLVPGSGSSFPAGSWARYDWTDFGAGQSDQFVVRLDWVSSPENGGTAIELRLDAPDGTLVGTVPFGQQSCRIAPTSGVHDLFLVFPSGNIQAVDWFVFEPSTIWTGDGDDDNWTTAANWSGTVTAGDALYFGASSRTTPSNDFPAGTSFAGITFDSDAPAYTLGGNGITLAGNLVNSSANDQAVNLPITLPKAGQIEVDTGSMRVTLAGSLGGEDGGLSKTGSGTLELGAVSYSGDVTIEAGALVLTETGLSRSAHVSIGTGAGADAVLDLTHGLTERVGGLIIDGVLMPDGTYGSSDSDATYKDNTAFQGTGMLFVQSGPCPPTYSTRADGQTLATFDIAGSGIWTVPAGVSSVEVLVVGGGGGGGTQACGAGAGGMVHTANYIVTPGSGIDVMVGAGGAAGSPPEGYTYHPGQTGGTSQFDQLLAYGGETGTGYADDHGGDQGGYSTNGGGTIIPGNIGGRATGGGQKASGGGAGAPGVMGPGLAGGIGSQCAITTGGSISPSTPYYAGGGGAPEGASSVSPGGGGPGAGGSITQQSQMDGTRSLGGGGGGGWGAVLNGAGGNGGSGVVIVAYQAVNRTPTTTELVSSDDTSVDGQSVTFTATVKDGGAPATAATGTFEFKIDGAVVEAAAPVSGGVASYTTSSPASGAHTVTATYSGDATYDVSAASITQTNITPQMLTMDFGTYGEAAINGTNVTIVLPMGTDLNLAPTYTTTAGASGDPVSGSTRDFTDPVIYTLTSTVDPAVTRTYTVMATIASFGDYSTRGDGKTVVTFSSDGTWTVPAGVSSLEVLVVGGGGGGGAQACGSGAGGMYYTASYTVTGGSAVNVAVGAGGLRGLASGYDYAAGETGGTSRFDQLLAYGGTTGESYQYGGGQGGHSTDGGATVIPGNPGGDGWAKSSGGGAGGAGIGGVAGAAGGIGLECAITGTNLHYAGGGGAPEGGSNVAPGGGGAGAGGSIAATPELMNGTDGLGGGGGGGWGGMNGGGDGGGNGGSGVVIVAYTAALDPYDEWAGVSGYNLVGGRADDDDGDGMTNFAEFAFGLNPTSGASVNPITDVSQLGAGTFSYTRLAASGLTYTVWASTDLQDWGAGPVPVTEDVTSTVEGVETVVVSLSSPPSGEKLFVRVAAQ